MLFSPTVEPQSLLAPERGTGRFLRHVLWEAFLCFQPDSPESRIEFYVNFLAFPFSELHGFEPSGVTGKHFGALDFSDHQAITRHQPQGRLQLGDPPDKDWLRPAGSILPERGIKDGARRTGEHEVAFLNTGQQILRGIFIGHP
jgi:hypothetical protein